MLALPEAGLVIDASVMINLLATDCVVELIEAVRVPVLIESHAAREVRRHPRERVENPRVLDPLVTAGSLQRVSLGEAAVETFIQLTGAPAPDDLGDGESGSIAHAIHVGAAVALDDGKARRICRERFPDLPVYYTVELLQHANHLAAVDPVIHRSAVFDALIHARMRVPATHREWVVETLGPELAAQCPYL